MRQARRRSGPRCRVGACGCHDHRVPQRALRVGGALSPIRRVARPPSWRPSPLAADPRPPRSAARGGRAVPRRLGSPTRSRRIAPRALWGRHGPRRHYCGVRPHRDGRRTRRCRTNGGRGPAAGRPRGGCPTDAYRAIGRARSGESDERDEVVPAELTRLVRSPRLDDRHGRCRSRR